MDTITSPGGLRIDAQGRGDPCVVLLHAGICDRTMWDRQFRVLATGHRVVRYDLRGFGASPDPEADYLDHDDLLEVMDATGIDAAVLVGASNGGRVALDAAVSAPERVRGLVLVGATVPGLPAPADDQRMFDREAAALDAGDVAEARAINLALWVDGVGRAPADVDDGVRARVAAWLDDLLPRQAAQLRPGGGEAQLVHPPLLEGLGTIGVPALIVVGQHDIPDSRLSAQELALRIPRTRLEVVEGAAHLVNLERPDHFDALLTAYLAGIDRPGEPAPSGT